MDGHGQIDILKSLCCVTTLQYPEVAVMAAGSGNRVRAPPRPWRPAAGVICNNGTKLTLLPSPSQPHTHGHGDTAHVYHVADSRTSVS